MPSVDWSGVKLASNGLLRSVLWSDESLFHIWQYY
jgi:hypothetical protein